MNTKKLTAWALTLCMALLLLPAFPLTASASAGNTGAPDASWYYDTAYGNGTPGDPYRISNADQLAGLASIVNTGDSNNRFDGKTVILTDDIDLSCYYPWQTIGTGANSQTFFKGTFDGCGYAIRNMTVTDASATDSYFGLFGWLDVSSHIKNLALEDVNISVNKNGGAVGGIAGCLNNGNARIENCYVTGTIEGFSYVGGIAGVMRFSTSPVNIIENCYSTATVNGTGTGSNPYNYNAGGLVGQNSGSADKIWNCVALNDSVDSVAGIQMGRVLGSNLFNTADLQNNYALASMSIAKPVTAGHDKIDGEDITEFDAKQSSFWTVTMGWDTSVWDFTDGSYPSLKKNTDFIPVIEISGMPDTVAQGTAFALPGIVVPSDATNKTITWSVEDAGTTGASITNVNNFETTAPGTITVRATVENGSAAATDYIEDFTIEVIEAEIDIGTQPAAITNVEQGSITEDLSVDASVTFGATLSYQWYSNTSASTTGATLISGATSASLAIPTGLTSMGGPYYYYCVASATGGAAPVASDFAEVIVPAVFSVTPPETGQLLTMAAATGLTDDKFTISALTWSPQPPGTKFLGSTVYTATITLTADSSYTFPSGFTAIINGDGATVVVNPGNTTADVSYTFPLATDQKTVTGIAVNTQPAKLTYNEGDPLDLSGLGVTLTYDDDTTDDIAFADFASNGLTADPPDGTTLAMTHDGDTVTITHDSGKWAETSTLTLGPPSLNGSIKVEPTSHIFTTEEEGYTDVETQEFEIENIGLVQVTGLSADLLDGLYFKIVEDIADDTFDPSDTLAVKVQPIAGLPEGVYSDKLIINDSSGIEAIVSLQFTVTSAPVYTATIDPQGGSYTFAAVTEGYASSDVGTVVFTITNAGTGTLNLLSSSIINNAGAAFAISSNFSPTSIAPGGTATIGVTPNTGLHTGDYSGDLVIILDQNNLEFIVNLELTVSEKPLYKISLEPGGSHSFGYAISGYAAGTPLVVNVKNMGNQATGDLSVALSGAGASSFTLSKATLASIAAGGAPETFTVVPKTGLSVGTHTATVAVSTGNAIYESLNISFTVTAAPVYSASVNMTNKTFATTHTTVYNNTGLAQVFILTNTGTEQITGLIAKLELGDAASPFQISSPLSANSISYPSGTVNVSVRPKVELTEGTHTDKLLITGDNGISITVTLSFTVTDTGVIIYGNLKGYGEIEITDLIIMLRYLANQDVIIGINAAKVSGDGEAKVNNNDLVLLLKYFAQPGVVLGPNGSG